MSSSELLLEFENHPGTLVFEMDMRDLLSLQKKRKYDRLFRVKCQYCLQAFKNEHALAIHKRQTRTYQVLGSSWSPTTFTVIKKWADLKMTCRHEGLKCHSSAIIWGIKTEYSNIAPSKQRYFTTTIASVNFWQTMYTIKRVWKWGICTGINWSWDFSRDLVEAYAVAEIVCTRRCSSCKIASENGLSKPDTNTLTCDASFLFRVISENNLW